MKAWDSSSAACLHWGLCRGFKRVSIAAVYKASYLEVQGNSNPTSNLTPQSALAGV